MEKLLLNRVAIITGAGRGLGKEYAEELAKQGAAVVICDIVRNDNGWLAEGVANDIISAGGNAIWFPLSVADSTSVNYMIDSIIGQFGRIDILIHNAGITKTNEFNLQTTSEWNDTMAIHLDAAFNLLSLTIPHMLKANYGRIILITSSAGMFGLKKNTAYSTAKMGIWGLVRTLNKEMETEGIICNAVSPLAVTSDSNYTEDQFYNERFTSKRVAPFVAVLCSEQITTGGRVYQVAGGSISRLEICESKGMVFSDEDFYANNILKNLTQIDDMKESTIIYSIEQAGKTLFKKIMKSKAVT